MSTSPCTKGKIEYCISSKSDLVSLVGLAPSIREKRVKAIMKMKYETLPDKRRRDDDTIEVEDAIIEEDRTILNLLKRILQDLNSGVSEFIFQVDPESDYIWFDFSEFILATIHCDKFRILVMIGTCYDTGSHKLFNALASTTRLRFFQKPATSICDLEDVDALCNLFESNHTLGTLAVLLHIEVKEERTASLKKIMEALSTNLEISFPDFALERAEGEADKVFDEDIRKILEFRDYSLRMRSRKALSTSVDDAVTSEILERQVSGIISELAWGKLPLLLDD